MVFHCPLWTVFFTGLNNQAMKILRSHIVEHLWHILPEYYPPSIFVISHRVMVSIFSNHWMVLHTVLESISNTWCDIHYFVYNQVPFSSVCVILYSFSLMCLDGKHPTVCIVIQILCGYHNHLEIKVLHNASFDIMLRENLCHKRKSQPLHFWFAMSGNLSFGSTFCRAALLFCLRLLVPGYRYYVEIGILIAQP